MWLTMYGLLLDVHWYHPSVWHGCWDMSILSYVVAVNNSQWWMVNERTRWWCWNLSLCYCAIGQTIKVFSCLSWNLNAVVIWRENQVWIHNTSDVFVITSTKQVMMSALFFLFLTFDLNTYISVTSYIVCRLCVFPEAMAQASTRSVPLDFAACLSSPDPRFSPYLQTLTTIEWTFVCCFTHFKGQLFTWLFST